MPNKVYKREADGHAYYYDTNGELMACPLNRDGTLDKYCEYYVCDFAFPLSNGEIDEIKRALDN